MANQDEAADTGFAGEAPGLTERRMPECVGDRVLGVREHGSVAEQDPPPRQFAARPRSTSGWWSGRYAKDMPSASTRNPNVRPTLVWHLGSRDAAATGGEGTCVDRFEAPVPA